MKLESTRIILTGAAGGIGSELAVLLAEKGARVALIDRDAAALQTLTARIPERDRVTAVAADLLDNESRRQAVAQVEAELGGVDVLINNAGLMSFRPFSEEDPVLLERIIRLNAMVPMLLARQVLPGMIERGNGRIVNIGSTFGSIGFAWFAAYSASKFGLRGFSEALRRELDGTGVGVTYVAPRAVKTGLNTTAVYQMANAVKMNMDEPAWVAARVVEAMQSDAKDRYLGFPESLFVRINALLPRLVDAALRKQNSQMLTFAKGENQ